MLAARCDTIRVLLLALLGALCGLAGRAGGQSFCETLPDALSDRELQRAEARLRLAGDQLRAVERCYEAYRTAYAALERDEIAPFRADAGRAGAAGLADPRVALRLHREAQRIRQAVAALDEQFLEQVQGLLDEEQLEGMARVRAARVRTRLRGGAAWPGSDAVVDLSEVVEALVLADADRATIDAGLQRYEEVLTRQLRAIQKARADGLREVLTARAAAASGALDRPLVETVASVEQRVRTLAVRARRGGRQTCRELSALLPDDPGRRLRMAFLGEAYLEIGVLAAALGPELDQALALEELDEPQRELVAQLRSSTRRRLDRVLAQIAELVDRYDADHSPFSFDAAAWAERERRVAALQREAVQVHAGAVGALADALGPDRAARLDRVDGQRLLDLWTLDEETDPAAPDGAAWAAEADPGTRPDPYVPPAITRRDLAACAEALDLDDRQRMILRCLHADYTRQVRALEPQLIEPILALEDRLWGLGDPGPDPPDVETVQRLYALRSAAAARIEALDRQLFDDLWLVLRDDQAEALARVKRVRQRQAHARGPYAEYLAGSMHDVSVDLLPLLEAQDLGPDALAHAAGALEPYEIGITEAIGQEYEAALRLQWALQEWEVVRRPLSRDTPGIEAIARPHIERVTACHEALRNARQQIRALNKALLARIAEGLDEHAARALRDAYRRAAWVEVYDDPESAAGALAGALALDDLDAAQRGQLGALRAEHEDAYARLCDEMIEIARQDPGFPIGNVPDVWRRMFERETALQRLLEERDELNGRTRRRLALVLTDGQVKRIGATDAPAHPDP